MREELIYLKPRLLQSYAKLVLFLCSIEYRMSFADTNCSYGTILSAEQEARFHELYKQGERLYLDKDYARAIGFFQKAVALKTFPNIIHNIGQSHKNLGHAREAVGYFSWFLDIACDLSPIERANIEDIVSGLTKQIHQQEERVRLFREHSRRPKWRVALGVVGMVAAVPLLTFGGMAASIHGQPALYQGKNDFSRVYNTQGVMTALMGSGAVSLVGGVVVLALPANPKLGAGLQSSLALVDLVDRSDVMAQSSGLLFRFESPLSLVD